MKAQRERLNQIRNCVVRRRFRSPLFQTPTVYVDKATYFGKGVCGLSSGEINNLKFVLFVLLRARGWCLGHGLSILVWVTSSTASGHSRWRVRQKAHRPKRVEFQSDPPTLIASMMTEGCWRGDKDCFGGIRMEVNWERKEDRKEKKRSVVCMRRR